MLIEFSNINMEVIGDLDEIFFFLENFFLISELIKFQREIKQGRGQRKRGRERESKAGLALMWSPMRGSDCKIVT